MKLRCLLLAFLASYVLGLGLAVPPPKAEAQPQQRAEDRWRAPVDSSHEPVFTT